MNSKMQTPHIYLGTGGYSDTDLIGTLYPFGTDKSDFLTIYSQHYDAIEINVSCTNWGEGVAGYGGKGKRAVEIFGEIA